MDLLQGAQRVESAASDQVLAGNGARTLTMTMSYTGGEEVVLNIMSPGLSAGHRVELHDLQHRLAPVRIGAERLHRLHRLHQHLPCGGMMPRPIHVSVGREG